MTWLDPVFLIKTFGLVGIWAIVFAESGLFFGFFLPGDSLLFTAGLVAAAGHFNIFILTLGCFLAAVLGDNVGYSFGKRIGRRIFRRSDSLFFKKEYLDRTKAFYERHGRQTIILARFVPIIRTFAPILAGVGLMPYQTFLAYNLLGALLWAVGITLLAYFLGSLVPEIENYLYWIILLIVLTSLLPFLKGFFKRLCGIIKALWSKRSF